MLVWVFVRAVVDGWSPSCEGRQGPLLRHLLIRSLPVQPALEPSLSVCVCGWGRARQARCSILLLLHVVLEAIADRSATAVAYSAE